MILYLKNLYNFIYKNVNDFYMTLEKLISSKN